MQVLKTVRRIPGGMMIVPLVLAALMHTFIPGVLNLGSFTSAIFSAHGLDAMIGLQLFFIGTRFKLRQAPEVIKRGVVLLLARYAAGAMLGLLVAHYFGLSGILGVSVLAIVSTVTGANGALYLSLVGEYGDTEDSAAMCILNLHDGPFLTLLTLGITGLAHIPAINLLAAVLPLLIGAILGNIDGGFEKLFAPGVHIIIPFIGFTIGATINLGNVIHAGMGGIVLGLATILVGGGATILADRRLLRRPGYAGAALSSSSGNSIANPAAVAALDAHYHPFVQQATVEIAASVVLTAILVPLLTSYFAARFGRGASPDFDEQGADAYVAH